MDSFVDNQMITAEEYTDNIFIAVSSRRLSGQFWNYYHYPIAEDPTTLVKEVEFLEALESTGLRINGIGYEELHDWDSIRWETKEYDGIAELKSDTEAMRFIGGNWTASGKINDKLVCIRFRHILGRSGAIVVSCRKKDDADLFKLLCEFEKRYYQL